MEAIGAPRAPARPATMHESMSPKRKLTHRPALDPGYIAHLRERVTAVGFAAVSRAGVPRQTLWRVVAPAGDRPPTLDAVERVRAAVAKADPSGPPVPPPFVAVTGAVHAAWCEMGARLAAAEPGAVAAAVTSPAALRAAVRAAARAASSKRAGRRPRTR